FHPSRRALCPAALEPGGPLPSPCPVINQATEGNTLNTDPCSPGIDNAGGKSSPATQRPTGKGSLRKLGDATAAVWWRFFDWLAVVSWKKLALVSLLGLILAGILKHPVPFLMVIIASIIIK